MDIQEAKKFAKNKIEADALTKQVRDIIKITKWEKQDAREGFKETFKPLIKSQDSIKKSIDEQQNATIAQLQANQLALTQGLNQNRLALTEGINQNRLAITEQLKNLQDDKKGAEGAEGLEVAEEAEYLTPTSEEAPKITEFKPEDLDRYLLNQQALDALQSYGYPNLPSSYFKENVTTISNTIDKVNTDLIDLSDLLKNRADFYRNKEGYFLARPKSKNPQQKTIDNISNYNALSTYSTNLNYLKYYKEKSGSGMIYFNNPHQLLDRLELLGGSILAGNNGVIPEFSQIAHLLNQMKVISKKQLNDLLKSYISIK